MPKLDGTHTADRLRTRLDQLLRGDEVAARDMKSLLTAEQTAAMNAAWAEQQTLRKSQRARTRQEETALGWKTKRDIHIEALTQALHTAHDLELAAWEKKAHDAQVRQGRVYLDELSVQMAQGVDARTASIRANNALTRAGLRRLDGQQITTQGMNSRDKSIKAMEDAIQDKAVSDMDDYQREQYELGLEHEKALLENRKRRGR